MAQQSILPIPEQLDIHNSAAAELWHEWRESWKHYSRATGLKEKDESIQVSTLLTVIGVTARRVFATFKFDPVEDENKIVPVLAKFEVHC